MTRLSPVLLCTCVLSCGEAALPSEPVATALQFAHVGAPSAPAGATAPPTVRLVGDSLEVVGVFGTDAPCYAFESRAFTSQVALIVDVEAVPTAEACIGITAAFAYRVALLRPAGVGRVVVRHDLRHPRARPNVVRDTTLDVP